MPNKLGNKQSEDDIEALKMIAIAAAESVYHYKLIARAVNRDEDTILTWRTKDKQFSDKLEQGRHRFIEKKMKVSRPEFLLERLEPELFKERKEAELNLNGNVQFINDIPRPQLGSASVKEDKDDPVQT